MIVNLPNGKTIELSLEMYLGMTEDDYEYLVACNWGDDINDPFAGSVLSDLTSERNDDGEVEFIKPICDVSEEDRLAEMEYYDE